VPDGSRLLARFDAKHDGKVTLEEYRAPALAAFDRLDKNHDGVLSPEEVQAARAH
jgi:Ca2+-binding EF-hand superfamily protein